MSVSSAAGLRAVAVNTAILIALSFSISSHAELSNDTIAGPGLRWRPAYDGSDDRRVEVVPIIRYLGEPLFVRSTQGVLEAGLRIQPAKGLHLGAQVAYEPGRDSGESDFLERRRMPGVNPGASIGVHFEWDAKVGPEPITFLARFRQHTDSDRGSQADLRLSAGLLKSGPFSLGAFAQTTWASAKSTDSFYGISAQQAAATALPAYSAGSGWLFGSAGLLWSFDFTRNWIAVGNVEWRHLLGDAEHSPLTERSNNYYLGAGLAYHF